MFCFLVTSVLRFALLPYYRRYSNNMNNEKEVLLKMLRNSCNFIQDVLLCIEILRVCSHNFKAIVIYIVSVNKPFDRLMQHENIVFQFRKSSIDGNRTGPNKVYMTLGSSKNHI